MTCAKTVVKCVIVSISGKTVTGENWCKKPQSLCPRKIGEDYEKCKSICEQYAHAEVDALRKAKNDGINTNGGIAILLNHHYACEPCASKLRDAGLTLIVMS